MIGSMTDLGAPASFDALVPAQMARRAEAVGETKAGLPFLTTVVLGILAGSFISLGALFSTAVTAGGGMAPGVGRLLGGLVFSLGLVLVVVGGAELFTGNMLIVIATAARRVAVPRLLANWVIVYVSNAVGAVGTACLVVWSGVLDAGGGVMAERASQIAATKSALPWSQALTSAVLANALVCLAIWMSMSARSLVDKVVAVVPPVTAFVAIGLEHSIANMYFGPVALLRRSWGVDADLATDADLSWASFTWDNIVPVSIGNMIGGGLLVGLVYWFVYLRHDSA